MAAMTSSNSNFQNLRKTYKVYILKIIHAKFHQNWSSSLGCSADAHAYTHPCLKKKWPNIKTIRSISSLYFVLTFICSSFAGSWCSASRQSHSSKNWGSWEARTHVQDHTWPYLLLWLPDTVWRWQGHWLWFDLRHTWKRQALWTKIQTS